MSSYYNFKKDKCWSCEFYCGHREYCEGGFLKSECVETEEQGFCANKRSTDNGKSVRAEHWCSRYQKWGVLQSALAIEEMQKQQEYQAQQQRNFEYNQRQQKEEIRREREALEWEIEELKKARKALEHERWYSSLSVEERKKYDEEQARLKAEEEARLQEKRKSEAIREEYRKREEKREGALKKATTKIILALVVIFLLLPSVPIFAEFVSFDIRNPSLLSNPMFVLMCLCVFLIGICIVSIIKLSKKQKELNKPTDMEEVKLYMEEKNNI